MNEITSPFANLLFIRSQHFFVKSYKWIEDIFPYHATNSTMAKRASWLNPTGSVSTGRTSTLTGKLQTAKSKQKHGSLSNVHHNCWRSSHLQQKIWGHQISKTYFPKALKVPLTSWYNFTATLSSNGLIKWHSNVCSISWCHSFDSSIQRLKINVERLPWQPQIDHSSALRHSQWCSYL